MGGRTIVVTLLLVLALPAAALAQPVEEWRSWNRPVEPFRIADGLYYVGANEIAAYLFTTPDGHILLDGGFAETAPLIAESLAKLGFALADVEILLNSHAHLDHPKIADDFAATFATLRVLPCDLPLGAHASFFRLEQKRAAQAAGAAGNPFVDPEGYRTFVERKERRFRDEFGRQRGEGAGAAAIP